MANIHPHIEAMLNRYDLKKDDPFEVLREILQEIVLYALSDAGFFKYTVFMVERHLGYFIIYQDIQRIWIFL